MLVFVVSLSLGLTAGLPTAGDGHRPGAGQNGLLRIADDPADTVNGQKLTDAPVPAIPPQGGSATDRLPQAGSAVTAGPVASTPFSGTPTSQDTDTGSGTAKNSQVLAPGSAVSTPELGR